jgi:ComF family protein
VVQAAARAFFSLFFPAECRVCGVPLQEISRVPVCRKCLKIPEPLSAEYFCSQCRTPFENPFPLDDEGRCALCRSGLRGFDAAYCFGPYDGVLRDLIHLFKYARIRSLERPLSGYLARALPREQVFDAVVPVPMHWWRRWHRGFNQSELLARSIARRSGIRFLNALVRTRSTPAQAGLSHSRRRRNVASAFRPRRALDLSGKRILLIDDVLTTGSTASACAHALKQAGAKHVALLTVARVDRRSSAPPQASPTSLGEGWE